MRFWRKILVILGLDMVLWEFDLARAWEVLRRELEREAEELKNNKEKEET